MPTAAPSKPETALTVAQRVEQSPAIAELESRTSALLELLPNEQAVARFKRGVVVAITKNPDLLKCTPHSIVLACFEAAQQGLEPTGAAGGAHLVPYGDTAQLIPDYRGVIRLITKPGSEVVAVEANVVKEGDAFDYALGTDAFIDHKPDLSPQRSAKPTTHAYAVFRLRSGGSVIDVMDRTALERIRDRGRNRSNSSPWSTDFDEMGKKTVIKRGAKLCPVPPDVRAILSREDELSDEPDADPTVQAAPAGPTRVAQLGSRLTRARNVTPTGDAGPSEAASDPEAGTTDGEFVEQPAGGSEAAAAPDAEPAGITREDLLKVTASVGLTDAEAVARARKLFPEWDGRTALTPQMRAALADAIKADAQKEVL